MATAVHEPSLEAAVHSAVSGMSPCARAAQPWVLAATILGSSLAFIDGTVVNVALPVLQRDLGATVADVQWVIEAYSLFLSAMLLVGGSLGDLYGRRRVFIIGTIIFSAASALCGLAPGIRSLIIARAAQGFGAALLIPGSLAIISSSFIEQDRGPAIGTWSAFTAITTAIGPVLGGWLISQFSWRAVFFINLPLALIVILISYWRVPESSGNDTGRLDWPGAVLITLGLGGIVFGLVESSRQGFRNPLIATTLICGVFAIVFFIVFEMQAAKPMLPLNMFRSSAFTGANLLTFLLYGALGGTLFFLPLNLIQVQHYSPLAAGAALLPLIMIIFVLSRWSGGLVEKYGARTPLVIGPILAAVGFVLFGISMDGHSYWTVFFPAIAALGVGMAISVPPLTTTVMNSVIPTRVGVASGVNNAVARMAGLLAIAILGIVMVQVFAHSLDAKLSKQPSFIRQSLQAQSDKLAAADVPKNIPQAARTEVRAAIDHAFLAGFQVVMFVCAGLAVSSAGIALLLIGRGAEHAEPPGIASP